MMYGNMLYRRTWKLQCNQCIKACVYVGQGTEQTEQKGCQSDVHRFPLSEDHNRKCKEAKTCNSVLEFPLADAGCDINQSAKSAKSAGDQNACITHFEHIDTYRVSCLGMLAACHKTKSESGFV